jgi:hypothetical protein
MDDLPPDFLNILPSSVVPAARVWWSGLAEVARRQIAELWDERREAYFFSPQPDANGEVDDWDRVPKVTGGRFVPHDDAVRMADWIQDWHEYLLGHPDVVLLPRVVIVIRTFHIGCRSHPAARAVLSAGRLPTDYQCPLGSVVCPMEKLQTVAPGHDLLLVPSAAGGWWAVIPFV